MLKIISVNTTIKQVLNLNHSKLKECNKTTSAQLTQREVHLPHCFTFLPWLLVRCCVP